MRALVLLAAVAVLGAADAPRTYLDGQPQPDLLRILPPPPQSGSPLDQADAAVFRDTRTLQGTPKWQVATADVTGGRFATFACAMGMTLDERQAPALARVFARMGGGPMVDRVKRHYAKRRPYLTQDLPICEPKTAHLAGNGDYPSGHTTNGWATALVLAELLPDRATEILERGRMTGESRFVCGSHSVSAVQAGFMAGSTLVAALHGSSEFRRDMDAARVELAGLRGRARPAEPARCAVEQAAR
ncbi:acid phosphatase (class A) [Sphingomonas guangdongensis]|uniref:Acid phosphatase n=1 Tax=Sphingomonas guangdongensis TaxID=1141890 RepID=A0A285QWR3_9SPHN|nr:phosphatase PAP2 family protein [Sphingomonas guangdongensis]SOB86415.1 acid phosphatase (class A) [Sphingomonas guangdongensis]